jgi:cell division protein FtsL
MAASARAAVTAPRRAPARRKPAVVRPKARPKQSKSARLAALPHSPFVDRLLTGRAWIVLVGGLLAGIVFLNVALLELNAGIARTSEQVSALKRENGRLRLQAARLGSTERIQQEAARVGLVLPAPGQVRYLKAQPGRDSARALANMRPPDSYVPVVAEPVTTPVPVPEPVLPAEPAPVAAAVAPTTAPTG